MNSSGSIAFQNPDRVAFSLFGRDIYWYGVLMATGILIAVLLAIREAKRKGMSEDTMLDLCLIIIPCGVVGARLYYVIFELKQYLSNPIRMLYIWEGGLAIYGAVIGGLLGLMIYSRVKKLRFLKLADCIAPGLILAQAIGRWGNFFNQEAYGAPITNPKLWWFPFAVYIENSPLEHPFYYATFFYESMWCLLVFLFLWFYLRKRTKHDGDMLLAYAVLYGFERMFVEGLRTDSLWLIPDVIRVSQLISFIVFAAGVAFILIRRAREKKLNRLIWPSPEEAVELALESAILAEEKKKAEKLNEKNDGDQGKEDTNATGDDVESDADDNAETVADDETDQSSDADTTESVNAEVEKPDQPETDTDKTSDDTDEISGDEQNKREDTL